MKNKIFFVVFFCLIASPSLAKAQEVKPDKDKTTYLDINLYPYQVVVSDKRNEDQTVVAGTGLGFWSQKVRFNLPSVAFGKLSRDVNFKVEGQMAKSVGNFLPRDNGFLSLSGGGSTWKILLGVDMYLHYEKVTSGPRDRRFPYKLSRLAGSAAGWGGVKLGSFNGNFIAVKVGGGYVYSMGTLAYSGSEIEDTGKFYVYLEQFYVRSGALETGLRRARFRQTNQVEYYRYERYLYSPDPTRFGFNNFTELSLKSGLELTPSLSHDWLRLHGEYFKNFLKNDSLFFRNHPPDFQLSVRFVF